MKDNIKDLVSRIKGLRRLRNASIRYSEYISESLNKSISYSEYIAENLDKSISYSEYLSENVEKSTK